MKCYLKKRKVKQKDNKEIHNAEAENFNYPTEPAFGQIVVQTGDSGRWCSEVVVLDHE